MKRHVLPVILLPLLLLAGWPSASGAGEIAQPFRGFDAASKFKINYADVDALYRYAVIDTGRSSREYAAPINAATGSKIKTSVKASTVNEGNRFYFELFKSDENNREAVATILRGLQQIPGRVPLENFTRDEQLAYWLNLYNIAMLKEVIEVYPKRSLKRLLVGRNSVLDEKSLEVAGVRLSLNDIREILKQNYEANPLLIYGMYQGIIGGPNIRRRAYTGDLVWEQLANNAAEFVNSNRGTMSRGERTFRVSSLYERNEDFFPDFEADLTRHLLTYVEGREKRDLEEASAIKANIDDWTVTDVYGTLAQAGGSFATNTAALLDSVQSSFPAQEGQSGPTPGNLSSPSSGLQTFAEVPVGRFNPEVLAYLNAIKDRQEAANIAKGGTVTVEELGEVKDEEDKAKDADEENPDPGID